MGAEPERGLHFIGLNANVGRQFEFLQNAWLASTNFADLCGETDPLVGTREPAPGCPATGEFTRPRAGGPAERVTGLHAVRAHEGRRVLLPAGAAGAALPGGSRRS